MGSGFAGSFGPPSLSANVRRDVPIQSSSCGIPANAAAYSLNLTVVPQQGLRDLVAWPTGQPQPGTSNLHSTDATVLADAAIVAAGTSGQISFAATGNTDLVIDVNGYFAPPGASTLQFFPVAPCRVIDTQIPPDLSVGTGPPALHSPRFPGPAKFLRHTGASQRLFPQCDCGAQGHSLLRDVRTGRTDAAGCVYAERRRRGYRAGQRGHRSRGHRRIAQVPGLPGDRPRGGHHRLFCAARFGRSRLLSAASLPRGGHAQPNRTVGRAAVPAYAVPARTFPLSQGGCSLPSTAGAYSLNIFPRTPPRGCGT